MEKDWEAVRDAYVNGAESYAALAKRFGVPLGEVKEHGKQEAWVKKRSQVKARIAAASSEQNSKLDARIAQLAERLIGKLEKAVDELDVRVVTVKSSQEVDGVTQTNQYVCLDQQAAAPVDPQRVKRLTDALKELKTVMDVRTPLDREEQEARIRKLRKEIDQDECREVVVTLKGVEDLAG